MGKLTEKITIFAVCKQVEGPPPDSYGHHNKSYNR